MRLHRVLKIGAGIRRLTSHHSTRQHFKTSLGRGNLLLGFFYQLLQMEQANVILRRIKPLPTELKPDYVLDVAICRGESALLPDERYPDSLHFDGAALSERLAAIEADV